MSKPAVAPAAPENPERELLPWLTGGAAMLHGCGGIDRKLGAAMLVETAPVLAAIALASSEDRAKQILAKIDARAWVIITSRWPAIERIAAALLKRRALIADDVAALLGEQ